MYGAGFDPAGLDMQDLGDPRRQEGLPGGYATQGQAVSAPYAEANIEAAKKTKEIGRQEVNQYKIYIKFDCILVDPIVPLPKPTEPKITT